MTGAVLQFPTPLRRPDAGALALENFFGRSIDRPDGIPRDVLIKHLVSQGMDLAIANEAADLWASP